MCAAHYFLQRFRLSTLLITLFLFSSTGGERFVITYGTGLTQNVCGILESDFVITVTAMEGDTELNSTSVSSNTSLDIQFGSCGYDLTLKWPNKIYWQLTEMSPYIDFFVSFSPEDIFAGLTNFTNIEMFKGQRKAVLQSEHSSFKCSKGFVEEYYQSDMHSSENIAFKVLVTIYNIQIQLDNVLNSRFSPPGPECHFTITESPIPPSPTRPGSKQPESFWNFWKRQWIKIAIPVACLLCILVGIGVWSYSRKRKSKVGLQYRPYIK